MILTWKKRSGGLPRMRPFVLVPHDLFRFTTVDEDVLDSLFEGGETSESKGQAFFAQENDIFFTTELS